METVLVPRSALQKKIALIKCKIPLQVSGETQVYQSSERGLRQAES